MTKQAPSKRVVVEGEKEDIIIALPRNVVDRILELLPVHDAARTSILSGVDFNKVDQTCCALQLIKSFPNLSKLLITDGDDNAETIMKYLETQTCLNRPLNKLEYVTISSFKCSKTEVFFVKLLSARTPSLVRMCIEQEIAIDSKEERNMTIKLMRFPRASTRAELFYFPFEVMNAD
ncbi:hypothetical protein KY290_021044 [Solanum tuberosum]|uniref:FBD domain-containing protein n=1 Tax=Solanum tuberosum TaxID=4113 RepID=A0ABQ7V2F6_SOLTU|nr:hypothetical protein KY289_020227 [Solanum tuberosum]KAH0692892.1 hypothetical protein KY285_019989 [Solanum tuberosum]KAH0757551.1 hypothetical protein KY290_021044 [Solanum tuberosum]